MSGNKELLSLPAMMLGGETLQKDKSGGANQNRGGGSSSIATSSKQQVLKAEDFAASL